MGNIRNKLTLIVSESGSLRTHEKDYQIRVWHFLSASFFVEKFYEKNSGLNKNAVIKNCSFWYLH